MRLPSIRNSAESAAVIALTAAGTALRLALWSTQSIVGIDGTAFIRMARSVLDGVPMVSAHQYGYPILIMMAKPLAGDWVLAARVVDLVFGVSLIPLAWLLGRSFVESKWLVFLPAAAVAFMPLPVHYSLTTMTEAPYLAFLMASFVLFARRRYLLTGLAAGAAYAIRPESLLAVVVMCVVSLWRREPRGVGWIVAGTAILVAAHVVPLGVTQGNWSLSKKTFNITQSDWRDAEGRVGESPAELGLAERVSRYGLDAAKRYPRRAPVVGMNLLEQGGWVTPVLSLAGITGGTVVLVGGVLNIVGLPFFFVGERVRFVLYALPFLWILAACAIDRVRSARRQWVLILLVIAGLGFSAYRQRPLYTTNEDGYFPELVEAGRWLREVARPTDLVFDRKPYVAFYADTRSRNVSTGTYDDVIDEVVREKGDYLVVNSQVALLFRKELLPLVQDIETIRREKRLAPIYYSESKRGQVTIIYRVVRPGGPPASRDEDQVLEFIASQIER